MATWKQKEAAIKALEKKGKVNPEDLIRAARDPDHPCHNDFTWNIEKAAKERWRYQARAIIRQCNFEVIIEDVGQSRVPYYVSDGEDAFDALPKMRSVASVSSMFETELVALHGHASRVVGIAESKRAIVGDETVRTLAAVCGMLAGLRTAEAVAAK